MKKMIKYFDTSSLLLMAETLFNKEYDFDVYITSITLSELENIKVSANKDYSIKYAARQLLHKLDNNLDKWYFLPYRAEYADIITKCGYEITNDTKILATAYAHARYYTESNIIKFVTNDLALKMLASQFFRYDIESIDEDVDEYMGYLNIQMDEKEMSEFYSNLNTGYYNEKIHLLRNEYLNILDSTNTVIDTYRWDGAKFNKIKYATLESEWLGKTKPFQGDIYQNMVIDSFLNNQITMIKGPAGTGKSYLSMSYLLHLLDKDKIDKIIIFCNPVATKNSAKLGFYPGSRDEKLLDSQIGNFLIAKLGGRMAVEQLINTERLILLPFSDIRGYDTSGMNAGIYITEAQNLDVSLLKLALQRIGEDSICIVEGDEKTQVDLVDYEGANNGMRRMSEVFRGQDLYGEVTLQKIHRSRIAEIAQGL